MQSIDSITTCITDGKYNNYIAYSFIIINSIQKIIIYQAKYLFHCYGRNILLIFMFSPYNLFSLLL
jgi:hypothetical protein